MVLIAGGIYHTGIWQFYMGQWPPAMGYAGRKLFDMIDADGSFLIGGKKNYNYLQLQWLNYKTSLFSLAWIVVYVREIIPFYGRKIQVRASQMLLSHSWVVSHNWDTGSVVIMVINLWLFTRFMMV